MVEDHRCFKWGGKICHNEFHRSRILDGIVDKIYSSNIKKRGIKKTDIREAIAGTEVESIIEFSRSIHAEMAAILAVAREGRHSLVGSTLFTTTYPCHNCARHIVAAGVSDVIYIQPYLKSLAIKLHHDAIAEEHTKGTHVAFRQYDGAAPRNYLKLFTPKSERKKNGELSREDPKNAVPVFRIPLDGPLDYESKVIDDLSNKEQT